MKDGKIINEITLSIPGKHNIYNALAAYAVWVTSGRIMPMDSIFSTMR